MNKSKQMEIAYFSAEIGVSSSLPTYSGGLGVLAGDHIKAAGDIGLKMCAITLLYREGYYKQRIDEDGIQSETYPRFDPHPLLEKLDVKFTLRLRSRDVWVQAYRFNYVGHGGQIIPIYFLDTDVEENYDDDRIISLRFKSCSKFKKPFLFSISIIGISFSLAISTASHSLSTTRAIISNFPLILFSTKYLKFPPPPEAKTQIHV